MNVGPKNEEIPWNSHRLCWVGLVCVFDLNVSVITQTSFVFIWSLKMKDFISKETFLYKQTLTAVNSDAPLLVNIYLVLPSELQTSVRARLCVVLPHPDFPRRGSQPIWSLRSLLWPFSTRPSLGKKRVPAAVSLPSKEPPVTTAKPTRTNEFPGYKQPAGWRSGCSSLTQSCPVCNVL